MWRIRLTCVGLLALGAVMTQSAVADGGVLETATSWSFSGIISKSYTTSIPGVTLFIEFAPAVDAQESAVYLGGAPRILLPNWPELAICRIRVDIDPHSPTSRQRLNTNWELIGDESRRVVCACLVPGSNVFKLDLLGVRKGSIDPPIGHFTTGKSPVVKTFTLELYVQELEGQLDEATKARYWEQRYAPQGLAHRREVVVPVQPPASMIKTDPELDGRLSIPPAPAITPTALAQPWAFEFMGFGDQPIKMWLAPLGCKDVVPTIDIGKEALPNGNRYFIPITGGAPPPVGTKVLVDVEVNGEDWGWQEVTLKTCNYVVSAPNEAQEVAK